MNRRMLLQGAIRAGALMMAAPLLDPGRRAFGAQAASSRAASAADLVQRSTVIDSCSWPGEFDPDAAAEAPLSAHVLADVRASGITAVNLTVSAVDNGPGKYHETVRQIAYYQREIADHPDVFLQVRSVRDIEAAKADGRLGLIFGFQDTSMLEGELARLSLFHGLGVRIVQPTYNRRNLMGDGCLEPADGGLSTLGHELIGEINRLGILLDLSHAGPRTIAEGIAVSKAPMAITHTGCRALADSPRNVHDRELRALADKGGVVGIYFMPFLRTSGQPHAQDVLRHLDHAVDVCGEDHVGVGTDGMISGIRLDEAYANFHRKSNAERRKAGIAAPGEADDVFNLIPEYNDPRRFVTLADDLNRHGWSSARIEKILGANFVRLFAAVWPDRSILAMRGAAAT